MNKLLYITDQDEYSENGTISALFDKHLRKYWDVDIVYVTRYKHSFQVKENHFVVPVTKKENIIEYLDSKNVDIDKYDFVLVRNKKKHLKNVLKNKKKYNYKVGYRISYPKKHHRLELAVGLSVKAILSRMKHGNKIKRRDNLVNKCDLFLPSSAEAHKIFYPNIHTESFPIWTGLDPDMITKNHISDGKMKYFVSVGTIEPLREFDVVLDAFEALESSDWHLSIITNQKDYINELLRVYPAIRGKISVTQEIYTQDELRDKISNSDIGIALLPRIDFFDTVIANKVINYYDCAVPALMTSNSKNKAMFSESEGFFSEFNVLSIKCELEKLLKLPKKEIARIGKKGQEKLLSLDRNYKVLAKDLAKRMDKIISN